MKKVFFYVKNYILIFFVCFALPFFVFAFLSSHATPATFENGMSLCGVDVSNLTIDQATQKLLPLDQKDEISLTIKFQNQSWSFGDDDFDVKSNIHIVLQELEKTNNNSSGKQKRMLMKKIKNMGFENKIAVTHTLIGIDEKIDQIATQIYAPAVNASAKWSDSKGTFEIVPSKPGFELNKKQLYDDIVSSLSKSNVCCVLCSTTPVEPKISTQDIKKALVHQSSFSTSYASSNASRKNNIKIACEAINNTCILPGEEFSFNQTIGVRTLDRGYKEANIIKDGKFVKGIGGGICQVSTTLYNSLLLANINVLESHKHSLPVSYVEAGFDAMVSWGSADLKFQNQTDLPIFVVAHANGSKIIFDIYGNTKPQNVVLKTRSEVQKTLSATDKIIPDTSGKFADKIMFRGEFVRVKSPKNGYEVKTFLDKYENGVKTSSTMLRHATYEAQNGIVFEGTEVLPEGMTIPKNNTFFAKE